MTITIDTIDTTIPLGRAAVYGTLRVDTERFSPEIHAYLYTYGLRQVLNDAMAEKFALNKKGEKELDSNGHPIKLADAEIRAKAEKRLDALYRGELRRDAAPADPIEAELHRLAREVILASYKRGGVLDGVKATDKQSRLLVAANIRARKRGQPPMATEAQLIERFLASSPQAPELRERAERNVAERAAIVDDLGV